MPPGANVKKLLSAQFMNVHNKLECLSLASLIFVGQGGGPH